MWISCRLRRRRLRQLTRFPYRMVWEWAITSITVEIMHSHRRRLQRDRILQYTRIMVDLLALESYRMVLFLLPRTTRVCANLAPVTILKSYPTITITTMNSIDCNASCNHWTYEETRQQFDDWMLPQNTLPNFLLGDLRSWQCYAMCCTELVNQTTTTCLVFSLPTFSVLSPLFFSFPIYHFPSKSCAKENDRF